MSRIDGFRPIGPADRLHELIPQVDGLGVAQV
jgi:hypothetical protein